jgi:Zn-dependent protease with chaperone function
MRARTLWIAVAAGLVVASAHSQPAPSTPDAAEQVYLQRDFAFVVSPEIESYLASIADKLLATRSKPSPRPRIILYSASGFNAMADTHHSIVISTEALRMLESEDELAALLGHELSHVVLDHPEKKSLVTKFPLGVESMGAIAAASDQLKAEVKEEAAAGKPTDFAKESVETSQNVSLFWSDLLAPNWNRKQESEADRTGFDMMRAAGYDPEAFATLFQKLHAAQLKRSARMEELRKSMVARAQAKKVQQTSENTSAELRAATNDMKNALSEKAVNSLFDGIAEMGKDYDSPEQRQEKLTKHAEKSGYEPGDKKPRSPLFAQNLQQGRGGALLDADAAALTAVAALEAGDMKAARTAISRLLPEAPVPAATGNKKGKKNAATKPKDAPAKPLASPHLAFAVGKWLIGQNKADQAEVHAKEWVAFSRAPAKAFLWRAAHQASRKEFAAANTTLGEGRQRLASGAPFLPQMVTYARAMPDIPRARALTEQCKNEEQKDKSTVNKMTDFLKSGAPSGIYAECLARLGTDAPPTEKPGNLLDPLKNAATSLKD